MTRNSEREPGLSAGALGRETLRRLLRGPAPVVENLRDLERQLQPNGIDLTVEAVWRFTDAGALGGADPGRRLPGRVPVEPSGTGWYHLLPGPYLITLHEAIHLPTHLMALAFPRSTLLRCGANLHTAVVDAGYYGQPEALLVVANPAGFELAVESAICQLVFFSLSEPVEGYRGAYQERFLTVGARGIEGAGGVPA